METSPLLLIHTTIRELLQSKPQNLAYYEDCLRSSIAAMDISILLSGQIPLSYLISSFQTSLQKVSEQLSSSSDDKDKSLAIMVWNPILSSSLSAISIGSNRESATQPKPQSKIVRKEDGFNTKIHPRPVASDYPKPNCTDVYKQLDSYLAKHKAPYASFKHIQCTTASCKFCLGMFRGISLTRCDGHRVCVPSGWFPHVGKPLWNSLRKKHDPNKTFTNPPRSIKAGEMPNVAYAAPPTDNATSAVVDNASWTDDVELDYEPYSPRSPELPFSESNPNSTDMDDTGTSNAVPPAKRQRPLSP